MSVFRGRHPLYTVLLLAAVPAALGAQIDYRNLDDDRPTRVEDAYPVERFAFEFLLPYALEREAGAAAVHSTVLELAYGLLPNAHLGLKAPVAMIRQAGVTDWGLSGLRAFALYNFNTESPALPAASLRADVTFPVGAFGGDETQVAVKGILTRSFGRSRIHLNGAARMGPDAPGPLVEGLPRWWAGVALDRTLFRQSLLLIGEFTAARAVAAAPLELQGGLGLRWQWRPTTVLDLGIGRRLRQDSGPDIAVTFGLSNAFAVAGLMPKGNGR